MSTLAEIESAAAELPAVEKRQLMSFLARQLKEPAATPSPIFEQSEVTAAPPRKCHSIMDIPVVSVGKILKPLGPDDDLLGEMLDESGGALRGSAFDLPPLVIGEMIRPLSADDDLLGEMLDDTRF